MKIDYFKINDHIMTTLGLPVSFTLENRDGALYLWRDDPIDGRHLHGLYSKKAQADLAIEIYLSERKKRK